MTDRRSGDDTAPPAEPPTFPELRHILAEITETATTDSGILQPGAAYAMGALAELVRAKPGCMPEHVADAIAAAGPRAGDSDA